MNSLYRAVGVYDPHDPKGASLLVYVDGEPGDRVPLAAVASSSAAAPPSVRLWGPGGEAIAAAAADDDWPLGFTIGGAPDWPGLRMVRRCTSR